MDMSSAYKQTSLNYGCNYFYHVWRGQGGTLEPALVPDWVSSNSIV